jgi:signal transduction histidine kinase/CheY-like chemotaxis protein
MPTASVHDTAKMKILIVDDEEIILNIAADVLGSEGYVVTTETNPLNAIETIKQNKFDFVLTDINMPEMNGLQMVKMMQDLDPDVAAIFMTGYANLETAKEAIQTGAYDYIMKPFELSELRAAVGKAARKRRELAEKSDSGRLDRLSELVEVLYTVGDKNSLLKLSLGLALVNSGHSTGFIACWEKKSGEMSLVWTDNVRQSDFESMSRTLDESAARSSFGFETPLRVATLAEHPFISTIVGGYPEVNTLAGYFKPRLWNTTLKVLHRDQFFMLICVQDESLEDQLAEKDLKLLNIVLNMAMVVIENVLLLEESQTALKELESLHDQIVNLERVATQGIMSAEIGHELNNYLNIVRSNFELLQRKAKINNPDDVRRYMRGIEESLDQMTRFTKGLVDSATLKSEKSEIDLDELIGDIISFLSPQKKFREIRLSHNKRCELPRIFADRRQLQQIFYNMLNNAAEAFAGLVREEKSIVIATEKTESAVTVTVSDNGGGIPKHLVAGMFANRFTTKTGGHGFGLIVCKKVVENHGGSIETHSVEGQGTTFRISFPFVA